MYFWTKVKCWFSKNKKYIFIGSSIALVLVSTGVSYIIYKNKKEFFPNWLKMASDEELALAYEKLKPDFFKTNVKSYPMRLIDEEMARRSAKEWFAKHIPNPDPNYRWTDKNRWERD